jgi:hypothetical protein
MDNELLTKTQLEAWNNSFEISTLKKQISRDTDYHNRLEQEVTSPSSIPQFLYEPLLSNTSRQAGKKEHNIAF